MPEHSSELSGQSAKIVHLDLDSDRLAKLLSFLYDGPQARAQLDWSSLAAIANTGDLYRFDAVSDLVARAAVPLLRLRQCSVSNPLSIFKFAAQRDYYDLAKFAISFFAITELNDVDDITEVKCESFDGVPGRYAVAFLRAMPMGSELGSWNWQLISATFDVNDKAA